jgi:hypothetical protein
MNASFNKIELSNKIRTVLLRDWDPLGIGDNPNLRDEYDSYIPQLARILSVPPVSKDVVLAYLRGIEVRQMGLPEDSERIVTAASNLVRLTYQ